MAIDIQDPRITRIEKYGYPEPEPEYYGEDFYGNEVFTGDEIYVLDDEFFLKEEISTDVIKLLEYFGAEKTIAK